MSNAQLESDGLKKYFSHSQFPHDYVDRFMPLVSAPAHKIFTLIVRKTIGWQREFDTISVSQFMSLTGIKSNNTVLQSIKELLDLDIIRCKKSGTGRGTMIEYSVNYKTIFTPPEDKKDDEIEFTESEIDELIRIQESKKSVKSVQNCINYDAEYEPIDENSGEKSTLFYKNIGAINAPIKNIGAMNGAKNAPITPIIGAINAHTKEININKKTTTADNDTINLYKGGEKIAVDKKDVAVAFLKNNVLEKLRNYGIDDYKINDILTNKKHTPEYINKKIYNYEFLLEHDPKKVKGTGYLIDSIVKDYADPNYSAYQKKNSDPVIKDAEELLHEALLKNADKKLNEFCNSFETAFKRPLNIDEPDTIFLKDYFVGDVSVVQAVYCLETVKDYFNDAEFWKYIGIEKSNYKIKTYLTDFELLHKIIKYGKEVGVAQWSKSFLFLKAKEQVRA